MVRSIREPPVSALSLLCSRARARAAASIAGLSRKLPASCCDFSRERTSRSRASSPAHASRRNASRSPGGRSSTDCSRLSTCFHRSESIDSPARQFAVEPGLGGAPVAHHGDGRHFEHLSRFFHAESAKEAHFYHLYLAGIEPRQSFHRSIQRHQVRGPVAAHHGRLVQGDMLHAASPFWVLAPCMLNQNAPHQLGRNGKKVCAILPLHALVIHQAHVGLIDQGRGLQHETGTLALHVVARQTVEFLINDGGQPFERALVPVAPGAEQLAYVAPSRLASLCRLLHSYERIVPPRPVSSNCSHDSSRAHPAPI